MATGDPENWQHLMQALQQQAHQWSHVECNPEEGPEGPENIYHNLLPAGLQGGVNPLDLPLDLNIPDVRYVTTAATNYTTTSDYLLEKVKELQERIEILETELTFERLKNNEH